MLLLKGRIYPPRWLFTLSLRNRLKFEKCFADFSCIVMGQKRFLKDIFTSFFHKGYLVSRANKSKIPTYVFGLDLLNGINIYVVRCRRHTGTNYGGQESGSTHVAIVKLFFAYLSMCTSGEAQTTMTWVVMWTHHAGQALVQWAGAKDDDGKDAPL